MGLLIGIFLTNGNLLFVMNSTVPMMSYLTLLDKLTFVAFFIVFILFLESTITYIWEFDPDKLRPLLIVLLYALISAGVSLWPAVRWRRFRAALNGDGQSASEVKG